MHAGTHGPPLGPADPGVQTQLAAEVEPAGDREYDEHATHAVAAAAPMAAEYVPAAQSVQTDEPGSAAYLPAPQSVHVTVPVVFLNLPATQAVHACPFGPVNPLRQTHCVNAVDPLTDSVLLGQSRQVEASEAPTVAEYWPTPQSVQAEAPRVAENLPATQLLHVAALDAPRVVENFPAGHAAQDSI